MNNFGADELQAWALENPGYFWDVLSLYYPFRAEDIMRYREYLHFGSFNANNRDPDDQTLFSPGLLYNPNIHWQDAGIRKLIEGANPEASVLSQYPVKAEDLYRTVADQLECQKMLQMAELSAWSNPDSSGEDLQDRVGEVQQHFMRQREYFRMLFSLKKFGVIEDLQGLNETLDEISDTRMYMFLNPWIWSKLFHKKVNYFLIEDVFAHFEALTGVYDPSGT